MYMYAYLWLWVFILCPHCKSIASYVMKLCENFPLWSGVARSVLTLVSMYSLGNTLKVISLGCFQLWDIVENSHTMFPCMLESFLFSCHRRYEIANSAISIQSTPGLGIDISLLSKHLVMLYCVWECDEWTVHAVITWWMSVCVCVCAHGCVCIMQWHCMIYDVSVVRWQCAQCVVWLSYIVGGMV